VPPAQKVGASSRIAVTLSADDTITVEDDGRGIPVALDPQICLTALDRAMTNLNRWRELAYLNAGLDLALRDERPGQPQEHRRRFDEELVAFARSLSR
jgi:DNA gyrase/topoisomerase IV subunit B